MRAPNKLTPPIERLRELIEYDAEAGLLLWRLRSDNRWNARFAGKAVGYSETNGYLATAIDGRRFMVHRLAWKFHFGTEPPLLIDHRDGDRLNNRPENLREADNSTNQANSKLRKDAAPLKGAHWNRFRGYWQSAIKIEGRTISLGRFETAEAAHAAYVEAAKRHFGDFARAL